MEFLDFLEELNRNRPEDKMIHVAVDDRLSIRPRK